MSSENRYQVFEVVAKNEPAFNLLVQLYNEKSDVYDFWTEPRNLERPMDIMVPPAYLNTFVSLMKVFNAEYRVKIIDVET